MGTCEVPISEIAINYEGPNSKPSTANGVNLIDTLCLEALSHCLALISERAFICKMKSIR